MNRYYQHVSIAIASGAVLAVAGMVSATVPNDEYTVQDENDKGRSVGVLKTVGSEYDVSTVTICEDFPVDDGLKGSAVVFLSTHPDSIKLKQDKAQIEQSQKDNRPIILFITGVGVVDSTPDAGGITNRVVCEKADIDGEVKTKKAPISGSFSASGKNCSCDGDFDHDDLVGLELGVDGLGDPDCGAYDDQLQKLATDCDGLKSLSGSFSGEGGLKKIKVKIKGDEVALE